MLGRQLRLLIVDDKTYEQAVSGTPYATLAVYIPLQAFLQARSVYIKITDGLRVAVIQLNVRRVPAFFYYGKLSRLIKREAHRSLVTCGS